MKTFRITNRRYAADLSGIGASLHGGRWNRKGTPLLYTSTSRSLATLEYLVHADIATQPLDMNLVTLEIQDGASVREIDPEMLPADWNRFPPPLQLALLGSAWAESGETLLLRVPSALVPEESSILICVNHPEAETLRIVATDPYPLDPRLLG